MPDHGEIAMPGGWTLSTMWSPVCGQSWADAFTCFIGMWSAMMIVMMLPAVAPQLWRHVRAMQACGAHRVAFRTSLLAAGYFAVWCASGVIVFSIVAGAGEMAIQLSQVARVVPVLIAAVVTAVGVYQLSAAKARHLSSCVVTFAEPSKAPFAVKHAFMQGISLGLNCGRTCAGITAVLLVAGVMDWRAMTVATIVIAAERLAPQGERIAWIAGALCFITGVVLMTRALWMTW